MVRAPEVAEQMKFFPLTTWPSHCFQTSVSLFPCRPPPTSALFYASNPESNLVPAPLLDPHNASEHDGARSGLLPDTSAEISGVLCWRGELRPVTQRVFTAEAA